MNYSIAATAGTPQSATMSTAFATELQATVTDSGNPVSGATVNFIAPGSGASGTFAGNVLFVSVLTMPVAWPRPQSSPPMAPPVLTWSRRRAWALVARLTSA